MSRSDRFTFRMRAGTWACGASLLGLSLVGCQQPSEGTEPAGASPPVAQSASQEPPQAVTVEEPVNLGVLNVEEVFRNAEAAEERALAAHRERSAPEAQLVALQAQSTAHVVCTHATYRTIDEAPGVVTDYTLEMKGLVDGVEPPRTVTLPGGTANGVTVVASDVPALEVGGHYLAFFAKGAAGRLKLRTALPATASGEVQIAARTLKLAEVKTILKGVRR